MAPQLDQTSLTPIERRVLERYATALEEALEGRLVSLWLFGSRARGEPGTEDSDVDLMVVSRAGKRDFKLVQDVLWQVTEAEGDDWHRYSAHVRDVERVAHDREIEAFFQADIDRDKVVLAGIP